MAIINQHINEFLDYYLNLNEPQYAVLLSGKWGSGKTHFIKQFKEKNKSSYKFIHISLFGLKSKEDIHKQVIFKLFGLENDNLTKATDFIGKFIKGILNKYAGVNIALSDIPIDVALKRESNQKVIFIFDDLERIDTGLSEVLGYINVLVEELGQRIILLANEDEIKDRLFYDTFKEKTIGKTFQIEQDFETAFETFLEKLKNSKQILQANQSDIKNTFDMAGYQNLRSLRQGILDFDRLMESFDEKFKTHHELMKEFIQIFFALIFEIKSGKYTISPLEISPKEQINKVLYDEDEQKPFIDHIVEEYYLDHSVLPNHLWIKFHWNQHLTTEEVSESLSKSRFFREQQEEWITLGHYLYTEQSEFEKALQETIKKLEDNRYDDPIVLMHITSTLLHLSGESLYGKTQEEIVTDIKEYINRNINEWKNIDTLDHHRLEEYHSGLPPVNDMSLGYVKVQEYLLKKAEEVRREGLKDKGDLLITYLNENNIDGFSEMLIAEKNKEILYRLPVFRYIEPKVFFDALIQVKNKHIRDVLNILTKRYQSIFAYEKEPVLEELDFWKEILIIANNHQVKIPYEIKDVWIKTHFKSIVENDIIQKIEKQLQQIEKEKNNV